MSVGLVAWNTAWSRPPFESRSPSKAHRGGRREFLPVDGGIEQLVDIRRRDLVGAGVRFVRGCASIAVDVCHALCELGRVCGPTSAKMSANLTIDGRIALTLSVMGGLC